MTTDPDSSLLGRTPGLPESHFVHDGLITKHPIRAVALAALRPLPGQMLWDLGTGAGSIAIEWCRTDPGCGAIGVEQRPDRAEHARQNAANLTLPGQVTIVESDIEKALPQLPDPDAIFIGGGLTASLAARCIDALHTGGRFVVNAVTLEAELVIGQLALDHGGELMRLEVHNGDHIGALHGFKPLRMVTSWTWVKP